LLIDPDEDDYAGLSSVQFLRYASRLPAYDGAAGAAIRRLAPEPEQAVTPGPMVASQQPTSVVEASPLNLRTNPLLNQFIDYG
jgi:hypothetical protein